MIEHLRNPGFETSLKVWPYRLIGAPLDEVCAMVNLHKTRLTFPGLVDTEREVSRLWLRDRDLYTWVSPFNGGTDEAAQPKAQCKASRRK